MAVTFCELYSEPSKVAEVVPRIEGAPAELWLRFATLASCPPGTLYFLDATLSGWPGARTRCGKKTPPVAMTAQRHGGLLLLRTFAEAWLGGVPASQASLRPVEVRDKKGLVSDAYALLEVHALYPLDRDGPGLQLFTPGLPHGAHVDAIGAPAWGEGRTPPARLFRLLERPSSLFVDEALLGPLVKATQGAVGPLGTQPSPGERPFPPPWSKATLPPFEPDGAAGARAAEAFWALVRGERAQGLREAALANPFYAVAVARCVDGGPTDETRRAAARTPDCAVLYALHVDRGPHPVTEEAARRHGVAADRYAEQLTAHIDEELAAVLCATGGHDRSSVARARSQLAPVRPWLEALRAKDRGATGGA